jgi:hypothetical protein
MRKILKRVAFEPRRRNPPLRSHEDQKHQALSAAVTHRVAGAGRRQDGVTRADLALFGPDAEGSCAVEDKIDLVGARVCMRSLLLAGVEAVDIAKHAFALEKVHLLQLIGREGCGRQRVLENIHGYTSRR